MALSLLYSYQQFGVDKCIHVQGLSIPTLFLVCLRLEDSGTSSFETSVVIYQSARCHIP